MDPHLTAYKRSQHLFPDQCCLTWIRTGESDAVFSDLVRRFGGDPSGVHPATWEDVEGEAYDDLDEKADGIMLAARHGVWTVVRWRSSTLGVRAWGCCVKWRLIARRTASSGR